MSIQDIITTVLKNPEERKCEKCGKELNKHQKTFCSKKCFYDSIRRSNEICKFCGKEYFPKSTDRITYCSRDCYYTHKTEKSLNRVVTKAGSPNQTQCNLYYNVCEICGDLFIKKTKAKAKTCSNECRMEKNRRTAFELSSSKKHIIPIACKECGVEFIPEYGDKRSVFCSAKCSRRYAKRGKNKNRKKARKYGVVYEPVDPMKVFRRDGWRCQICGKSTPKKNRGALYSNAPELDHRIPISKGGDHLYSNVQCACRQCNGKKSNNNNAGCLPLFGVGSVERLNGSTAW